MRLSRFRRLLLGAAQRPGAFARVKGHHRCRPMVEALEGRLAPAVSTVSSTFDTDGGLGVNAAATLRKAIRPAGRGGPGARREATFGAEIARPSRPRAGGPAAVPRPVSLISC